MPSSVLSPYTTYPQKNKYPSIKNARAYMRARSLYTFAYIEYTMTTCTAFVQIVMDGFRFAYGLVVRYLVAYSLHDFARVLIELG